MACPISPSLKDLPKVAVDLKSQLEGFNFQCLKDVDTNEKNVLPSAQGNLHCVYFMLFCVFFVDNITYLLLFLNLFIACDSFDL